MSGLLIVGEVNFWPNAMVLGAFMFSMLDVRGCEASRRRKEETGETDQPTNHLRCLNGTQFDGSIEDEVQCH